MESGAIKDSQLSASSELNAAHGVHFSRLRPKLPTGRPGAGGKPPIPGWKPPRPRPGGRPLPNCWVASFKDHNPWLQVDLKNTVEVIGIATQGLVTKYKIQFREMDHQPIKIHKKTGEQSETVRIIVHSKNSFTEAGWLHQIDDIDDTLCGGHKLKCLHNLNPCVTVVVEILSLLWRHMRPDCVLFWPVWVVAHVIDLWMRLFNHCLRVFLIEFHIINWGSRFFPSFFLHFS